MESVKQVNRISFAFLRDSCLIHLHERTIDHRARLLPRLFVQDLDGQKTRLRRLRDACSGRQQSDASDWPVVVDLAHSKQTILICEARSKIGGLGGNGNPRPDDDL